MRAAVRGRPWLGEKGGRAGGRSRDWRCLPVNRRLDHPENPWISPGNALSAALTRLVRTPIAMRVRRVACPVLRPGGQFRSLAPPGPAASPSASQRVSRAVSCALSRRPVTGWCHGPDNRPGLAPRAGVTPPAPYAVSRRAERGGCQPVKTCGSRLTRLRQPDMRSLTATRSRAKGAAGAWWHARKSRGRRLCRTRSGAVWSTLGSRPITSLFVTRSHAEWRDVSVT
jgi:hypothetical protein